MERAIEFILNHHAQVSADIERLKEVQERTSKDIIALAESQVKTNQDIQDLTSVVVSLVDTVSRQEAQAEADRTEIREAINNLIIANETTRDLAEKIGRLAVQTSQRVTNLESK